MFRIRKIFDSVAPSNRDSITQVLEIFRAQFPKASTRDFEKLPEQLADPLKFEYKSILLVAENSNGKVKGFAMLLHMPDVNIVYLEFMSVLPSGGGGGVGGALYEHAREEAHSLGAIGLFFECSVDDETVVSDDKVLKQNRARLKFYERYGARPILNNVYSSPVTEGDEDLYYLVVDDLSTQKPLKLNAVRKVVGVILKRKYGNFIPQSQIDEVVESFKDDPIQLRAFKYVDKKKAVVKPKLHHRIALIVNEGHDIHHVKDKGYVEAPVRISVILSQLDKTGLFDTLPAQNFAEKHIKEVHDEHYVDYLRKISETQAVSKSIYPVIFPIRNTLRLPKDLELQAGYYCIDTFTPINKNAYLAARGAVNCAMTGAEQILGEYDLAYALVRPPGHHAERRAFGGFCYFNSAAVAAHHLSQFGKVVVLDIDFHHGNGTQDIFYNRSDVLTISIHGDPHFAYPYFTGFADEKGVDEGLNFNINYPLAEDTAVDAYQKTLKAALKKIKEFNPAYLVVGLGLDTAKDDPTGTWKLMPNDFKSNGQLIGELKLPTLIVQEGGYRTRTLGNNAAHFFTGIYEGVYA